MDLLDASGDRDFVTVAITIPHDRRQECRGYLRGEEDGV